MNWKLKVTLLTKSGMSREDAMEEVLNQTESACREMDVRLAKCMEHLSPAQIQEIFG